jgi:hypothetical protein
VATVPAGENEFVFSGSDGVPGWPYYVLASTNLALPVSQWPVVATNTFDAAGNFNFTSFPWTNSPDRFFLLEMP